MLPQINPTTAYAMLDTLDVPQGEWVLQVCVQQICRPSSGVCVLPLICSTHVTRFCWDTADCSWLACGAQHHCNCEAEGHQDHQCCAASGAEAGAPRPRVHHIDQLACRCRQNDHLSLTSSAASACHTVDLTATCCASCWHYHAPPCFTSGPQRSSAQLMSLSRSG
jgi:hypothetical protein